MQVKMEFHKEDAEEDFRKKLPELQRNPQLKAMQRALTTMEIETAEALIHAAESSVPKDVIADYLVKMAVSIKLEGVNIKTLEAGNEFGRDMLRKLPPTLN